MGQYDGLIAEAKKIGDKWIKQASVYTDNFQAFKKGPVAQEKATLRTLQGLVDSGAYNDAAKKKQMLAALVGIEKNLDGMVKSGQSEYDKYKTWAMGGPRASMQTIRQELELDKLEKNDKKKSFKSKDAYEAISKGCNRQLVDVANSFKEIDALWLNDISVALKTLQSSAEAQKDIIEEGASRLGGFIKQLDSQIAVYAQSNDKIVTELKYEADAKDMADLKGGKLWQQMIYDGKLQQYEAKLTALPKIEALALKNRERIVKSVPKDFLDNWSAGNQRVALTKQAKEITDHLAKHTVLLNELIKFCKEKNPVQKNS